MVFVSDEDFDAWLRRKREQQQQAPAAPNYAGGDMAWQLAARQIVAPPPPPPPEAPSPEMMGPFRAPPPQPLPSAEERTRLFAESAGAGFPVARTVPPAAYPV